VRKTVRNDRISGHFGSVAVVKMAGQLEILEVGCRAMERREINLAAGRKLRELRLRAGLGLREVERLSLTVVERKKNRDYLLSHTWLSDIEKGIFRPSISKMCTLAIIYQVKVEEIMAHFGLNLGDVARDQTLFGLPKTRLVRPAPKEALEKVTLPLRLKSGALFEHTNLLDRLVDLWGDIPVTFLQGLEVKHSVYGLIGLSDFTMYPILRPGSIVQIDGSERRISDEKWQSEHERPLYFIELRGEYLCSWCEIRAGRLLSVPYPNSRYEIRSFAYPQEADIVGRVTGVAMRFATRRETAEP
jgi:transcriptional regulator with XRE-family HTH domain